MWPASGTRGEVLPQRGGCDDRALRSSASAPAPRRPGCRADAPRDPPGRASPGTPQSLFLDVRGSASMTAQRSRVAGVTHRRARGIPGWPGAAAVRVVDVRVAHQHGVDAPRIERQLGVELRGVGTVALEEPGVQQYAGAGGLQQVHRAGDLARGAPERDLRSTHRQGSTRSARGSATGSRTGGRRRRPDPAGCSPPDSARRSSAAVKMVTSGWAVEHALGRLRARRPRQRKRIPRADLLEQAPTAATALPPVASIGSSTKKSRSISSAGNLEVVVHRPERVVVAVEADVPPAASGISCAIPSTMPSPARRIGTSVELLAGDLNPAVHPSRAGFRSSTGSVERSLVTS